MKLLGSTKINGENVPHLEITEVLLVHCNIVNNDYQRDLRAMYTFVPKKSSGQLLNILPRNFICLRTLSLSQSFHILKYGSLIKVINR